jgi:Cytochrome P460
MATAAKSKKGQVMKLKSRLMLVAAAIVALGWAAVSAQDKQDKYALKTPSGIAFSDFRGYEDWAAVSSTHTPNDRLKVMVANPTMIKAYRDGIPGNGQPFPDGSKIVKLQWKIKKSTEATFDANIPDTFAEVFLMQKDSKRFPDSGGWGYAVFNYDPATDRFTPTKDPTNCGHVCHVAVKAKDYVFHPYQKR